ncbi:type IV pilus assembly protein PilM [Patescibacteria group bacterium]|nr:type IV pilus assembly protein PilM [Patescibacteria group bacterium]
MSLFKKKSFGLEISDNAVKVAELSGKPMAARLDAYGASQLDIGVVDNGGIFDKKKLAEGIAQAIEKASPGAIDTEDFIFALPESKVFIQFFEIPNNVDSVSDAIRVKASEVVPIDFANLVDDYMPVLEGEEANEYLYVAAQKDVLTSFFEVFEQVGIEPYAVEFESAAMVRALFDTCPENHASLLVDIGARTTIVSIYDYCSIVFSKNIQIAGNTFTKHLSEGLKVSMKDAEQLKIKSGLDPKTKKGKSATLLKSPIDEIIAEISQVLSFYKGKTDRPIKEMILCGGSSRLKQLPEYMHDTLGIPVKVGLPLSKIKTKKGSKKAILSPTVIGLALRSLEKKPDEAGINLLANL